MILTLAVHEWIYIAVASWLIVSAVVAVPVGRALKRAQPAEPDDDTQWIAVLPPVPPSDARWLDPWPTDDRMSQQQVDRLFDDLIALEGLS